MKKFQTCTKKECYRCAIRNEKPCYWVTTRLLSRLTESLACQIKSSSEVEKLEKIFLGVTSPPPSLPVKKINIGCWIVTIPLFYVHFSWILYHMKFDCNFYSSKVVSALCQTIYARQKTLARAIFRVHTILPCNIISKIKIT